MSPPDCAPIITKDIDGWRVAIVRAGKVHVYLCETESDARRFAELLGQAPSEPPARKKTPAPPQERRTTADREEELRRLSVMRPPPRWSNGR